MYVCRICTRISVCLSVCLCGLCWGFAKLNSCLCLCCSAKLAKLNLLLPAAGHWGNVPTRPPSLTLSSLPLLPLLSCNFLQLLVLLFALWLFVFGQDCGLCCLVRLSWSSSQFVRLFLCPCALKIENHNRINFGSSQKFVLPPPPSPKSRQRNARHHLHWISLGATKANGKVKSE